MQRTSKRKTSTKGKRATREPNHRAIAEELERILSSEQVTDGQYELLTDIMLELSNTTQVSAWHPEVVKAFYLAASQRQGEMEYRDDLAEALKRIKAGDKFTAYRGGDHLHGYALRLRAIELSKDRRVSKALRAEMRQTTQEHFRDFAELVNKAEASMKKGGAR
ncbi:MAG: hypothetical protein WBP93_18385 [Pyrinomonadaceae bacterium]